MTVQATRYNQVETAVLLPGVDFITKSPNGPFIDTGYSLDFAEWKSGSRIYLSVDTIREMATIAGLFDSLSSEETIAHETDIYNRGYSDAVKENVGGELRSIAEQLGFVADRLGDFAVDAPVEPAADAISDPEPAGAVVGVKSKRDSASGAAVTSDSTARGQSTRARSSKRPAGVPSNTGDESRFRI